MSQNETSVPLRRDAAVIGAVGFAHGTSHFYHLLLPPLFPWLMKDFGLNYTEVGALMTVFFTISGAGQAMAGFPVDRYGAWRVLCIGIAGLVLSGLALGFAQSYPMLMLAAALAGIGNSVFHPADFTLLNRRVSPPRLGHAFSAHGLSGNLGWAAGPVLMVAVAGVAGWRAAAFAASAVGAAALVLVLTQGRLLDDRGSRALPAAGAKVTDDVAPSAGTLAFLGSPLVWMCFAFFFISTMALGVLQNFAPALLHEVYGLSLGVATSSLTAYMLGSAAGMITGGFLAARNAHDRVIALALSAAAMVAVLLATGAPPSWSVPFIMAVMGFGVGSSGPSRDLLVRRAATLGVGQAAFGRVYGFVYSGLDIGFALAPLAFGPLLDAGKPYAVLYGVAVLQVLAVATVIRVGKGARHAPAIAA